MTRDIFVVAALFLASCKGHVNKYGPIDVYDDDMIWYSSTTEGPDEPSSDSTTAYVFACTDFQECTSGCNDLEFDDMTEQLRKECVAKCRTPGGYEEFFASWGLACANATDLCDEGLITCESLN